ncbi:hypothetical protein [Pseudosulfitobacter pseudonitzschiae]|uniref:hypothetical protein n=1 Tax=Pseudosulfitobacter pseudonitzschiae TaxID=1402135 RepID=UPI001E3A80D7|nr:hypothetical protein [Pseudosulfitobacter pseudonitzschiae]MCD2311440.1 hypothetical protein [Pseudosulfitobacter pseudonitzschiae]
MLADEARRHGFDGVVCGHIHSACIRKIDGLDYINTGDWVESCTAVVEDMTGTLRLIDWAETMRNRDARPPRRRMVRRTETLTKDKEVA